MPYTKTVWVSGVTPVDAAEMNNLETQYDESTADSGAVRKTADETVNNSAVLQNDNELLFAMGVNERFVFECVIYYTTGGIPGFAFFFTKPVGAIYNGTSIRHAVANQQIAADLGQFNYAGASSPFGGGSIIYAKGIVINGANVGNFQLQWCQAVANASDTKVLTNSYLSMRHL